MMHAAVVPGRRLLWYMMHAALPEDHEKPLPFDETLFYLPGSLLPDKLKAPLTWAWSEHLRPLLQDMHALLESEQEGAAGG